MLAGPVAGAAAKLELANQNGPHWPDPLKTWVDVLAKQDKVKDTGNRLQALYDIVVDVTR